MSESWIQIIAIFIANFGLLLWFRAESRNDWRKTDSEIKEFRELMFLEIKDFHGRLCSIEERKLKDKT